MLTNVSPTASVPPVLPARSASHIGAVPALVVYVVALFGIPSALIIGPLGSAGTPAQVIGIGLFGWWLTSRFVPRRAPLRTNPVKWLLAIFAVAILTSYVMGMCRPISYAIEVNSSDRALLSLAAWCGVVLIFADGVGTRARLDNVLKVVAGGVTAVAFVGVLQFLFRIDIANYLHIPGLRENSSFGGVISRSKYNRVQGTAAHPIEFGVVLSSVLPLLIHYARFSRTKAQRRRWAGAVGLVAICLPMCVARSAAVGGFIAFAFLFFTWPAKTRTRALLGLASGALVMSVVVPGLLGTIRGLFLNASSDPSTAGRTADYVTVQHYFEMHPIFGRGVGTFIPGLYRTLDNAYLGWLIEVGIVGLLTLLALLLGSAFVAGNVRRQSANPSVRDLAQSLIAGLAVMIANCAFFDAFGFAMCAGVIFVLIGAVAALWNVEARRGPLARPHKPASPQWIRLGVLFLVIGLGATAFSVKQARPEYRAYATILLVPPTESNQPAYENVSTVVYTASELRDVLNNEQTRADMKLKAPEYEVAFKDGSLEMGSDVDGFLSPTLYMKTAGSDPAQTAQAMTNLVVEARSELAAMQRAVGMPASYQISFQVLQQTPAIPVKGRRSRAALGFLLLSTVALIAYYQIVRRRRANQRRFDEEVEDELAALQPYHRMPEFVR